MTQTQRLVKCGSVYIAMDVLISKPFQTFFFFLVKAEFSQNLVFNKSSSFRSSPEVIPVFRLRR